MSNDATSLKRMNMDLMKLMKSGRTVYTSDRVNQFWVEFHGPEGTPYEDGTWILAVHLPSEYPFKSPSIGFSNRILHPNVDEASGSVCLDVINQTWTPMYELQNIFDMFLPQLLRYPNPQDPLNPSAARQLQSDPIGYVATLQQHVAQHATRKRALACIPAPYGPGTDSDDDRGNGNSVAGADEHTAEGNGAPATNGNGVANGNGASTTLGQASAEEEENEEYEPDEIDL